MTKPLALPVLRWLLLLACLAPRIGAEPTLHFANGVKIGEVGPASALVWTRLTAVPEMRREGRSFAVQTRDADADAQLAGHPLSEFIGAVPGAAGEVRLVYWPADAQADAQATEWRSATPARDFTGQFALRDLSPATRYELRAEARPSSGLPLAASYTASFTTAPRPEQAASARFAVVTCQDFPRRDDPVNGHTIYQSMLGLRPDFFVHTGDSEYFDRADPWATRLDLARFKWNRIAALPFQREFHRHVASYFMKDDHDLTRDDASPGQSYGQLTWDEGLALFREQVPMGEKTYRRVRWGRDLEVWLLEGRDFRSPNDAPDGPAKTLLGAEQKNWLRQTLAASDATFRIVLSPTPVVGPDRADKNDNLANPGFTHEGDELRAFLASQKNTVVICGDRHWQYISKDPATGLLEFSCGSASDAHAGGFRLENRSPAHLYLAIIGGFLTGEVSRSADGHPRLVVRHHDVAGKVVNELTLPAPP